MSDSPDTDYLFFSHVGEPAKMVVDNLGKVGIETTTPAEFLEIKGETSGKALAIYTPLSGDGTGSNIRWYSDTTGASKKQQLYLERLMMARMCEKEKLL